MPRTPRFARFVAILASFPAIALAAEPDYKNPDLPFEKRVADLIQHITLEEKAEQMQSGVKPNTRLGIPGSSAFTFASHGIARADKATVYPVPISMAAAWDPPLIQNVASAIADEARAKMNPASAAYTGLILFSPMVNVARDPRWGRTHDTFGEDPLLTSRMGVAYIKGAQGNDPKYLKTAATPMYFAMYSQETDRLTKSFSISERTLREYYFPPFRACFEEARAPAVTTAYNGINDTLCAVNPWLLTDLLRNEWGFQGSIVGENSTLFLMRKYGTQETAFAAMLNAGVDVICDTRTWTPGIVNAVNTGLIKEEQLDRALARSLLIRFRLGMFDPPEKVPFANIPPSIVGSKEHTDLALQVARESIVLLKNDVGKVLPLNLGGLQSIALLGPYANSYNLGTYSGIPINPTTPIQALKAALGDRVLIKTADYGDVEGSMKIAASSDYVIAVVGLNNRLETDGIDRPNLELPIDQRLFLDRIVKANPLTIVVLQGGGASSLPWLREHSPAILMTWYPGEQGANALVDVLLGKYNPAGRLPLTFYNSAADLPPLDDYEISKGRTYMYAPPEKVAYPFGYGLSYSTFTYKNLRVISPSPNPLNPPNTIVATLDITNNGPYPGDEVAQLYVAKPQSAVPPRPVKQLKAFQRLRILNGETKTISLNVPVADLAYWDAVTHKFQVEPGPYELQLGASSEDIRLHTIINIQ